VPVRDLTTARQQVVKLGDMLGGLFDEPLEVLASGDFRTIHPVTLRRNRMRAKPRQISISISWTTAASYAEGFILKRGPDAAAGATRCAACAPFLSEQFRVPVILMLDECVGHMTEKVVIRCGSHPGQ